MKKIQLIVFTVILSLSALVFASGKPLFGAPTPHQSYQSAGSPHQAITVVSAASKTSSKKPTLKARSSEVTNELESQMNTLNQATLLYQQETNQKIERLSKQNEAVQSKLNKLTQAMVMMNQQLSVMSHGSKLTPAKHNSANHISISALLKYAAFGLVALLALLMGVLISRQKKLHA